MTLPTWETLVPAEIEPELPFTLKVGTRVLTAAEVRADPDFLDIIPAAEAGTIHVPQSFRLGGNFSGFTDAEENPISTIEFKLFASEAEISLSPAPSVSTGAANTSQTSALELSGFVTADLTGPISVKRNDPTGVLTGGTGTITVSIVYAVQDE